MFSLNSKMAAQSLLADDVLTLEYDGISSLLKGLNSHDINVPRETVLRICTEVINNSKGKEELDYSTESILDTVI